VELKLGVLVLALLLFFLTYRHRAWLGQALSESDGSPSASRLTAFLATVVVLGVFAAGMTVQIVAEQKLPPPGDWGEMILFALGGGFLGYGINKAGAFGQAWANSRSAPPDKPKEG
jgi:hypothetical protein